MSMLRCDQGHFYDDTKHRTCPWCGVSNMDLNCETQQLAPPVSTVAEADEQAQTTALHEKAGIPAGNEARTVAISRKKLGMDPVVGWLVCVDGPDKGRDYRIHAEKNSIGRADSMDIAIKGDTTISRENHAYVVFSPKKKSFRIEAGDARGLVYVNNEEVIGAKDLVSHDAIEIGESKFLFVPFCGEEFNWGA